MYADHMVNEVVITNEDQNVWRCYLARGQYDTGEKNCGGLLRCDGGVSDMKTKYPLRDHTLFACVYAGRRASGAVIAARNGESGEGATGSSLRVRVRQRCSTARTSRSGRRC